MGTLAIRPKTSPYHVGDNISFRLGVDYRNGLIVEERGPLGAGGRELFGVQIGLDPGLIRFDLPIDEIRAKFPTNEPLVKDAFESVQRAIESYKSALGSNDPGTLKVHRGQVRNAYKRLLMALKATAAPDSDLDALAASVPADVVFDVDVALVTEVLPKISNV